MSKYDGNCEAITNTDKNKQEVSKSFTTFTSAQGLANNSVWSIAEDKNGNLWFGAAEGLSLFLRGGGRGGGGDRKLPAYAEASAGRQEINDNVKENGNKRKKVFTSFTKNNGLPDNFIAAVRADKEGNIILGANFGLWVISYEEVKRITEDLQGFGNLEGLEVYNQFTGYPIRDVNTGQDNGTMEFDSKGILWVGHGSNGVTRVELNEIIKHTRPPLVAVEKVKVKEENLCWYTMAGIGGKDGEIASSASLPRNDNSPDSDSNGVPVIPNGAQRSEESPQNTGIANDSATVAQQEVMEFGRVLTQAERDTIRKQFADIRFDGITKWYPLPENLVLPYANNHVTFEYNAIVTDRHFLVNYQYKLQGQDEKWSPVTQKTDVSYGNLYEGDYTFLVKAQYTGPCEGAGCEWTEPVRYSFTVLPPWYRTWWAYSGYGIIALCLVWLVVWLNSRRLVAQKKLLEEKVQIRTKQLAEKNKDLESANVEITKQKEEAEKQRGIAEEQKLVIEEKHKEITDSIRYAQRIQSAILPSHEALNKALGNGFLLYLPKDVVAGDFYWMEEAPPILPIGEGQGAPPEYFTSDPALYPLLKDRAMEHRNNPTEAEKIAWELLRANKIGFHIRRQHIIGNYIVDFVNVKTKTVFEIDGDIHDYQKEEDAQRTQWLEEKGFEVVRFKNEKVIGDPDGFCKEIKTILNSREASHSSPMGRPGGAGTVYFAAADCTGHGVPGAMVSVVCSNALSKALLEEKITETGKLLDRVRELVIERFSKSGEEVKDGMDISICALDKKTLKLQWSGANNPLYIIRKEGWNTLPEGAVPFKNSEYGIEIKHDKQAIGMETHQDPFPFTTHRPPVQKGDMVYLFSDGLQDQFGGPRGKKFGPKRLRELLAGVHEKPVEEQEKIVEETLQQWKGEDSEQVDDIVLIGVRIG